MSNVRAYVEERIAALLDFFKANDSSVGANNSVEIDVQGDTDDALTFEQYENAEIWDCPAVLWRPSDPDVNPLTGGYCELLGLRSGDEIVVLAGKERRWQVSIDKGEVIVRGLAENSGYIRFKTDGTIEAGSTGLDFVALAAKVLTELQAVKTDLEAVKTIFDGHTHILTIAAQSGTGATGTAAVPATPITAPHTPGSVASSNLKAEG